jgi:hypothetical protein
MEAEGKYSSLLPPKYKSYYALPFVDTAIEKKTFDIYAIFPVCGSENYTFRNSL